jgi:hypothetical protein
MEFFYCRSCGNRVTGVEIQNGEARRSPTQIRCADCMKKASKNTRRLMGIVDALPPQPSN